MDNKNKLTAVTTSYC